MSNTFLRFALMATALAALSACGGGGGGSGTTDTVAATPTQTVVAPPDTAIVTPSQDVVGTPAAPIVTTPIVTTPIDTTPVVTTPVDTSPVVTTPVVVDVVTPAFPADLDPGPVGATTPTWVQCANESFLCTFSGTKSLRFGTGSSWTTLTLTDQAECNVTAFTDPAVGRQKVCQVLVDAPVSSAAVKTPKLGVYLGGECVGAAQVGPYTSWLGRKPDRVLEFLANYTWANLEDASLKSTHCWIPTGLPVTFSVAMLPSDNTSSLAEGAAGLNDEHFRVLARNFVKNGQANAVIRLGWEFNFPWYIWHAGPNPAAWIQYWRNIVTAMRSVEGQNFKFDWCPAIGQGEMDVARAYPGDAYVDYIGMDIYNQTWASPVPTAADLWVNYTQQWFGLYWQRDFALVHGKQMSYPEWGTGTRPDGHGLGDDPAFVQNMTTWIASNNVAYHNYWDYQADDYDSKLSDGRFPLSGALFRSTYGR